VNPITHFLVGWSIANSCELNRRERAAVSLSAVVPDLDGLGVVVDFATRTSSNPTELWGAYHHVLGHNFAVGVLASAVSFSIATRRWLCAVLAFLSFHLHILGDIVGGRGPDGDQWPIPYLAPLSDAWQLSWSGQWELNAWPNIVLTIGLLALTFYLACRRRFSPLELISERADSAFVATLRRRFRDP
jgi:hypothetical protein